MFNLKTKFNPIILFLVFVFSLPLISVLLIKNFTVFQSGFSYLILYGFEAITPTLSALLVVTMLYGRDQTVLFIKKCFISNIKIRYIVLAVSFPFMVFMLTEISCVLFLNTSTLNTNISIKKFIIILWALLAEEVGWRGFLQEKLDQHLGKHITPIIIGLIWALWHYHFFLLGSMSAPLFLFVLGCIADSYGYYWLTKKSKGNIISASVWHFTGNLLFSIFMIYPEYNHGDRLPYLFFVIYSFIMAIGITTWGVFSTKKEMV